MKLIFQINEKTPLFIAIENEKIQILKILLSRNDIKVNKTMILLKFC